LIVLIRFSSIDKCVRDFVGVFGEKGFIFVILILLLFTINFDLPEDEIPHNASSHYSSSHACNDNDNGRTGLLLTFSL